MANDLKARLKKGDRLLGTMLTIMSHPELPKILKVCGFDYFIVDCEHNSFNFESVATMLTVAREAGIPGLVRVPEAKREVVLKFMEMGASGLLLPNADTPEQARALVEYAKYYPMGKRGVALLRSHSGFEKVENPTEYMKKTNEDTVLMAHIESPIGVANAEKILDVEGIDALFIGPNDLSQSMGIMGQYSHPDFIAAIDHVIASAKAKGKFSGIHLMSVEALEAWTDKGMTLNLWGNEVLFMMNAAKEGLSKIKTKA